MKKKMKEMVSKCFKENIKDILDDSMLEYWVRDEVQRLLAKGVFDKAIKPMLTKNKIAELLQDTFNNYVYENFGDKGNE